MKSGEDLDGVVIFVVGLFQEDGYIDGSSFEVAVTGFIRGE